MSVIFPLKLESMGWFCKQFRPSDLLRSHDTHLKSLWDSTWWHGLNPLKTYWDGNWIYVKTTISSLPQHPNGKKSGKKVPFNGTLETLHSQTMGWVIVFSNGCGSLHVSYANGCFFPLHHTIFFAPNSTDLRVAPFNFFSHVLPSQDVPNLHTCIVQPTPSMWLQTCPTGRWPYSCLDTPLFPSLPCPMVNKSAREVLGTVPEGDYAVQISASSS